MEGERQRDRQTEVGQSLWAFLLGVIFLYGTLWRSQELYLDLTLTLGISKRELPAAGQGRTLGFLSVL